MTYAQFGDIGTVEEFVNVYRHGQISLGSVDSQVPEATVQFFLSAISAEVCRYCGVDFTGTKATSCDEQVIEEFVSGNGSPFVRVSNIPISNVIEVAILDGDSETVLSESEYRVNDNTGLIGRVGTALSSFFDENAAAQQPCFPEGFQNVRVTYETPYTYETAPADLRMAVYETLDERLFNVGVRGTENAPSIGDLIKQKAHRFNPFRRVVM